MISLPMEDFLGSDGSARNGGKIRILRASTSDMCECGFFQDSRVEPPSSIVEEFKRAVPIARGLTREKDVSGQ